MLITILLEYFVKSLFISQYVLNMNGPVDNFLEEKAQWVKDPKYHPQLFYHLANLDSSLDYGTELFIYFILCTHRNTSIPTTKLVEPGS